MKKAIIFILVPICGILVGIASLFLQDFRYRIWMARRYPGFAIYGKIKRGRKKYAHMRI